MRVRRVERRRPRTIKPGFAGVKQYVELLEDLDEPKTGLEAKPPTARGVVLERTSSGKLVKSGREIRFVNRGRGIFYEAGTRGYWENIGGEFHFFPIECDVPSSSSSSSSGRV